MARIPLGTFAISFGVAGLAAAWDVAYESIGLPVGVEATTGPNGPRGFIQLKVSLIDHQPGWKGDLV